MPADALRAQLRWTSPNRLRNFSCALLLPHHLTRISWERVSLAAVLCPRNAYLPWTSDLLSELHTYRPRTAEDLYSRPLHCSGGNINSSGA